jgi:hypothetical protein
MHSDDILQFICGVPNLRSLNLRDYYIKNMISAEMKQNVMCIYRKTTVLSILEMYPFLRSAKILI